MPRLLIYAGLFLFSLALVPLAFLYRAQNAPSTLPRMHVVPDMDDQAYHRAQEASSFFADGRAMRRPVEGTVKRGDLRDDEAFYTGKDGDGWIRFAPIEVDATILARGQERFGIYCSPCHGQTGQGDGMIARRAARLAEGTWTPPSDLTATATLARPDGEIFDMITRGVRKMPSYASQIPVADRWAVVTYVRALQRSAHGTLDDVPEDRRAQLE